jgi:hypothetical protein
MEDLVKGNSIYIWNYLSIVINLDHLRFYLLLL